MEKVKLRDRLMIQKAKPIKEVKQKRYDELMRYTGKIEAIHLLLESLDGSSMMLSLKKSMMNW